MKEKANAARSNDIVSFIAKVAIASALISGLIKYGGPHLPLLSLNTLNKLVGVAVVTPSILFGILLLLLWKKA